MINSAKSSIKNFLNKNLTVSQYEKIHKVFLFIYGKYCNGIRFVQNLKKSKKRKIERRVFAQFLKQKAFDAPIIPPKREKPHFLVLMWRYIPGSNQRLSTEHHNVLGSLRGSGLATFEELCYDEAYSQATFPDGEDFLLQKCIDTAPDALILSSYDLHNLSQPRLETLRYIAENFKIPIVPIWWDSVNPIFFKKYLAPMKEWVSLNLFIDSSIAFQHLSNKDSCLHLWAPQDPLLYYNPEMKRDIDVSFLGSTGSYRSVRKEYLGFLKQNDVPIFTSEGSLNKRLSDEEYAQVFMKSKISLNFSHSVGDRHQLKGRVFEVTLCGALLMEAENSETAKYFEPYEEYVPFKDKEDLLKKIHYYLENPSEREKIAAKGYQKATELYNHRKFWEKVITGLKLSHFS
ncbi:hypothetical protein C0J08_20940 [Marinomonas sp. CT5]|uniref:glycosyltransferase family protein n=1 Tax=Marinomonas sp. CT5 TaxID=2066133 RepID=UPI001BAE8BFD|nr:glycosyltransferase [Marinomonas sp. CT5]QUX97725.1 hypothetical protein C0J08_20940 [Marinomonas sp. CT5]